MNAQKLTPTAESLTGLTAWESKERAELLALETDEWRQMRLIAEDPDTTGDVLGRLADAVQSVLSPGESVTTCLEKETKTCLLIEALTAHPNTPLPALLGLLSESPLLRAATVGFNGSGPFMLVVGPMSAYVAGARGIRRNPVLPFLSLESPDFWLRVCRQTRELALSHARFPAQVIHHLLQLPELPENDGLPTILSSQMRVAAQLHIGVSGEIKTRAEGQKALTEFWRTFCQTECREQRPTSKTSGHHQLVKLGFAHEWATEETRPLMQRGMIRWALRPVRDTIIRHTAFRAEKIHNEPFTGFVASLYGKGLFDIGDLYRFGTSSHWVQRLYAAIGLPLSDSAFPRKMASHDIYGDEHWNRSPLDLLNHLAYDGNRLVRWAAQTRLAAPGFIFTWYEESEPGSDD